MMTPPRYTRALRSISLLALALGLATVAGYVVAGEGTALITDLTNPHATKVSRHHYPTRVLFPTAQMPLYFSHEKHVAQDIECVTCHEDVEDSLRSTDNNLPSAEACSLCHEVSEEDPAKADPPAACSTCHLDYDGKYEGYDPHEEPEKVTKKPAPVVWPNPNLKFNHKAHVSRGVECSQCHYHVDKVDVATVENAIPVMGDCMGCHNDKEAPGECTTCHVGQIAALNRIQTDYPQGKLKPHGYYRNDAHNENFVKNHVSVAREDEGYCLSCHQREYCVDCHNGVAKPVNIHPANWILVHPISARKNSQECGSCHRQQSFCTDCHRRSGVMDLSSTLDDTVMFHPNGWVNNPGEAPARSHHMFEAQRNIRACVSCHEERTCLKCHSNRESIGFGVQRVFRVSPHPPDFRKRCKTMRQLNDHACLKCHDSTDPLLSSCQ